MVVLSKSAYIGNFFGTFLCKYFNLYFNNLYLTMKHTFECCKDLPSIPRTSCAYVKHSEERVGGNELTSIKIHVLIELMRSRRKNII